jgi:hypothetical protein
MLRRLAQGVVYLFLLGVFYLLLIELIGHAVGLIYHPFAQWVDSWGLYLLKLAIIHFPCWLFVHALRFPMIAFGLGTFFLIWLYQAFHPGKGWLAFTTLLLLAAWFSKDKWEPYLPTNLLPLNTETAKKDVAVAANTPVVSSQVIPATPVAIPKHVIKTKAPVKKGSSKKALVETQNLELKTQNSLLPQPTPVVAPASISAPVENERDADAAFVLKFAQSLYSIGYQNYQDRETTLLGWVTKEYAGDLKGHYFNPYVLKNMESIHRTKTFTPDSPVKWVFSNETTEEFMISGTITLQGGMNTMMSMTSTKHVKASFDVVHDPQGKAFVKKINDEISD